MRIDEFAKRTVSNPTSGIVWNSAENKHIAEMAVAFAELPQAVVTTIRHALAHEALRLEDAYQWTTPGSEAEQSRQAQYRDALMAYEATYMINAARAFRSREHADQTLAQRPILGTDTL